MKKLTSILLAAALGLGTSAADTFNVTGTGPNGETYSGTVDVIEIEGGKLTTQTFNVVWKIGADTINGVGVVNKDNKKILSVGYFYKGTLGVATMLDDGGGNASGTWWVRGASGVGTEKWTKAK